MAKDNQNRASQGKSLPTTPAYVYTDPATGATSPMAPETYRESYQSEYAGVSGYSPQVASTQAANSSYLGYAQPQMGPETAANSNESYYDVNNNKQMNTDLEKGGYSGKAPNGPNPAYDSLPYSSSPARASAVYAVPQQANIPQQQQQVYAGNNKKQRRNRRKYCCCFTRKRYMVMCIIFSILILVAIALAIFFCVPRIKSVDLGEPTVSNLALASTLSQNSSLTLNYPITIDSNGYVDYNVRWVDFTIHLYNKNTDKEYQDFVGSGHVSNVKIAKKGLTTLDIPTNISYVPANGADGLGFLVSSCSTSSGSVPIKYKLRIRVKGLVFVIPYSGTSSLDCGSWYEQFQNLE